MRAGNFLFVLPHHQRWRKAGERKKKKKPPKLALKSAFIPAQRLKWEKFREGKGKVKAALAAGVGRSVRVEVGTVCVYINPSPAHIWDPWGC